MPGAPLITSAVIMTFGRGLNASKRKPKPFPAAKPAERRYKVTLCPFDTGPQDRGALFTQNILGTRRPRHIQSLSNKGRPWKKRMRPKVSPDKRRQSWLLARWHMVRAHLCPTGRTEQC